MKETPLKPDMLVAEVMNRFPQTLPVFIRLKLDCIGCDLATFCSLSDVAADYHIALSTLIAELSQAIEPPAAGQAD
jgi:hybrid cluster-associated redox disulfide protein